MREGQADIGLIYVECSVQIRLVVDTKPMPIKFRFLGKSFIRMWRAITMNWWLLP